MPKDQKNKTSKTVVVHQHIRHVPVSKRNPDGTTVVDQHLRHIQGRFLDQQLILDTFKNYDRKNLKFPAKNKLKLPDEDLYNEMIAVWCDYFTKTLPLKEALDPNMLKALIATESTFDPDSVNKKATGLTQITTSTLKILQDLDGEAKDFVFKDIRKKDLTDPNVSIALGARWLAYKKQYAEKILKRQATSDEVIQLYKGVLRDDSLKAKNIMERYREFYEKLKK